MFNEHLLQLWDFIVKYSQKIADFIVKAFDLDVEEPELKPEPVVNDSPKVEESNNTKYQVGFILFIILLGLTIIHYNWEDFTTFLVTSGLYRTYLDVTDYIYSWVDWFKDTPKPKPENPPVSPIELVVLNDELFNNPFDSSPNSPTSDSSSSGSDSPGSSSGSTTPTKSAFPFSSPGPLGPETSQRYDAYFKTPEEVEAFKSSQASSSSSVPSSSESLNTSSSESKKSK